MRFERTLIAPIALRDHEPEESCSCDGFNVFVQGAALHLGLRSVPEQQRLQCLCALHQVFQSRSRPFMDLGSRRGTSLSLSIHGISLLPKAVGSPDSISPFRRTVRRAQATDKLLP